MRNHRAIIVLTLFVVACLIGCGAKGPSSLPATNGASTMAETATPQRISSSKDSRSFASESGKNISGADIDRFIDPSITGSTRTFAHLLLSMEPKNMRGDFVYIGQDGTVLSNRPQVAAGLVKEPLSANLERPQAMAARVHAMAYPPAVTTGTGPYVREYSGAGVMAFYGYVSVPCGDTSFEYNEYGNLDVGYLYSGTFGASFSAIDAGLQYNSDSSIQPFLATNYTANPQWTNQSQHYSCGSVLMIEYGSEPIPSQLVFMGVGISSDDPTGSTPPPNDVAEDAVDLFFTMPSDFTGSGKDSSGLSTICTTCVTKRMSSIGQKGGDDPYDGSCFGGCQGPGDEGIHWGPIAMGQFSSCTDDPPTTIGCQMTIVTNGSWYGGIQEYSAGNGSAISANPSATSSFEGFWLVDPPTPTPAPRPTPTRTPSGPNCLKDPSLCDGVRAAVSPTPPVKNL